MRVGEKHCTRVHDCTGIVLTTHDGLKTAEDGSSYDNIVSAVLSKTQSK